MAATQALIVVIDDDKSMGPALTRLLTAAGFRVRSFDSAEAPGAVAIAGQADCLVLDMRLPGVGGTEFYAALPLPRPPAVFITAHDGPAAQRNAQRVGGRACLGKPFDGKKFLEIVARAVMAGTAAD